MQSILQYRRFKHNLQQQIQKYGVEATAALTTRDDPSLSEFPSIQDRTIPTNVAERDYALEGSQTEQIRPTASSSDTATDLENADTTTKESSVEQEPGAPPNALSEATTRDPSLRQTGTRLGQLMTGVSVRSQKTVKGINTQRHIFVVGYQGPNDKLNPHNWSLAKRVSITILMAFIALIVGFASSVDSAAINQAAEEFGVSIVTESLATGLYLVGFGFGAFVAAPLSETVGRNPVYLGTGTLFMIFIMASGLSPNIGAQLVFRTLAGFFGSTPLTCSAGTISDMWNPAERTYVFPVFANSAFWGPVLGPVVGGFIGQSFLNWRWCEWISLIWAGLIFGSCFLFLPETYAPVLLKWKAQNLRKLTGDDRYMSELEITETTFRDRVVHNLYRPWLLLTEPIVVCFILYLTVTYIVLFTFLTGFDYIFGQTYGLPQGLTFLIFVTLGIGFASAWALVPFVVKNYKRAQARAQEEGKAATPPEARLIFAMIGAPFLPIGLFWMGWTAYPSVSIWSPIIAALPIGLAIITIFISSYQYLIDCFEMYAASALVGATFVRYCVAGGMIPVSIPFYENMGVHWTLTILGGISAVMVPVPYLFYRYGAAVRSKSRYAANR